MLTDGAGTATLAANILRHTEGISQCPDFSTATT